MQRQREINRQAWADEVQRLIRVHARGNQTQFAAMVGVTARTVHRWLNQQAAVSEESVRSVAEAVGVSAMELLVRIGYYTSQEAQAVDASRLHADVPPPEIPMEDEESIRLIMESDAPADVKDELVREIRRLQQQHEAERVSFAQRLLDVARRVTRTT
jgi:DNA-binding transcriptional regulator YdaS (Cro superfamily)